MNISLWECDTGIFDWILNKNTHNCGLATYKFDNHAFELKWDVYDLGGDIVPFSCPWNDNATAVDAVSTPTAD